VPLPEIELDWNSSVSEPPTPTVTVACWVSLQVPAPGAFGS
jgi:hypothetical protein